MTSRKKNARPNKTETSVTRTAHQNRPFRKTPHFDRRPLCVLLAGLAQIAFISVLPTPALANTGIQDVPNSGDLSGIVATGNEDISGGRAVVDTANVSGNVYGAYSNGTGKLSDNSATIKDGFANTKVIYGAYSFSGNAENNKVEISGSRIQSAAGGYSRDADATGNTVTISGNSYASGSIVGGSSQSGNASNNTVTVSGNTTATSVRGGLSQTGNASGNTVNISGGSILNVFGGQSLNGSATGNTVNISGGAITKIIGGFSQNATAATGNTVNISGGTVTGAILGGQSNGGDAFTNNTLNMNAAPVSISQVKNFQFINFTYSGDANITNLVTDTGQNVAINTNANAVNFGGTVTGAGDITKKGTGTLTLSGENEYTGKTTIAEGTLKVSGKLGTTGLYAGAIDNNGTLEYAGNGEQTLSGEISGSGKLTKTGAGTLSLSGTNTYTGGTTINAGLINFSNVDNFGAGGANITLNGGGLQWATGTTTDISSRIAALETGGGTFDTNGNDVTLANSLNGSGGLTKTGEGTLTLSGPIAYNGMTTVINGNLTAASSMASSSGLTLYGGASFTSFAGDTLNGKKLIVNGANNQSATYNGDLLARGADLHFIFSANPTQPLLNVTGDADISNSTWNIGMAGNTRLTAETTLTLLEVGAGKTLTATGLAKGSGIIQVGSTIVHDFTRSSEITPENNKLLVTVKPGEAKEQAKALSEGFLGGMSLALQGADMAAETGMAAATSAVGAATRAGSSGIAAFGTMAGHSLRYKTGSHVDANSFNMLAGLALGTSLNPGRMTIGAFVEYGNGSYDTYNSFSNAASIRGDGNTWSVGGGLLARMDFTSTGPGHFYAEASGRIGKLHNKYDNGDLRDAAGRTASYKSSTPYYSAHAGAGYIWKIKETATLDLYGKYLWTRVDSDNLTLSTGEDLRYNDVNSQRIRLGGRIAFTMNKHVAPYVGAAFEHEFDGKAQGTTNGFAIDSATLRGSSGIAELGLTLTPSADLPLSIDLGLQGHVGQREGVSGNMRVQWKFR